MKHHGKMCHSTQVGDISTGTAWFPGGQNIAATLLNCALRVFGEHPDSGGSIIGVWYRLKNPTPQQLDLVGPTEGRQSELEHRMARRATGWGRVGPKAWNYQRPMAYNGVKKEMRRGVGHLAFVAAWLSGAKTFFVDWGSMMLDMAHAYNSWRWRTKTGRWRSQQALLLKFANRMINHVCITPSGSS